MTDPSNGTFRPLEQPDRRLPGRTAILASGQTPGEQAQWVAALARAELAEIPIVFVNATDAAFPLDTLAARPPGAGLGQPAAGPRAVVLSGLTEAQLHRVMAAYKSCRLPPALWAMLTPTTQTWSWAQLTQELLRERQALGEAQRQARGAP